MRRGGQCPNFVSKLCINVLHWYLGMECSTVLDGSSAVTLPASNFRSRILQSGEIFPGEKGAQEKNISSNERSIYQHAKCYRGLFSYSAEKNRQTNRPLAGSSNGLWPDPSQKE